MSTVRPPVLQSARGQCRRTQSERNQCQVPKRATTRCPFPGAGVEGGALVQAPVLLTRLHCEPATASLQKPQVVSRSPRSGRQRGRIGDRTPDDPARSLRILPCSALSPSPGESLDGSTVPSVSHIASTHVDFTTGPFLSWWSLTHWWSCGACDSCS